MSLRTRDPAVARALGTQVTGMAGQLRQRVGGGTMTVEQARDEIATFLGSFPFYIDPKILDRLEANRATPLSRVASPSLAYSLEQEHAMVLDFAQRMGPILDRRADEVLTRPTYVLDGERPDWVAESIQNDLIQAEVCRILALSGTSACVRAHDRGTLIAAGFSEKDIDDIDRLSRQHAIGESSTDWLIGPERDVLVFHLQVVGAIPTIENVARLRRATLFVLAGLLKIHVTRYLTIPAHLASIVASPLHPATQSVARTCPVTDGMGGSSRVSAPPPIVESPIPAPSASSASFLALVETLIESKTQTKSREWDDKTARQHRSIAKLFVKNAGTDDPAAMMQEHIGRYLDLLRIIPTHYGKSGNDEERTIDEIVARSEDLDDDEIGLAAPTINRHRTQLGSILAHMEEHGFSIGSIHKRSRAKDPEGPGEKRIAFTEADGHALMGVVARWSREVGTIDPDALFWVPILCWYLMLRLSEAAGLVPGDIDLADGLIHIRGNELRRVKTRSSIRTLPIPAELMRLGFAHYVARRQTEGTRQLFPNLFTRKSDFAVVFQKIWAPVLDEALPTARQNLKTLHSTRKGGNSAMIAGHVPETTRLYIMGHAKLDTNGRHYTSPPSPDAIRDALKYVPLVTADLKQQTS